MHAHERPDLEMQRMQKRGAQQPRAAAIVAVALAVATGACGGPPTSESSETVPTVATASSFMSDVANDLGSASDSVMRKLGFGPADEATPKEVPATPAAPPEVRARAPRPKPAPVAVPVAVDPQPPAIEPPPMPVPADLALEEPAEIAPAVSESPLEVDDFYTAADLDVAPPVLRSADLPRWPSERPNADALEVMVSQEGDVERIRFVSEPRRMVDMMKLSVAKMWRFDPALKDGEPVRYRLVMTSPSATYRR